jgi:hypothetical protein
LFGRNWLRLFCSVTESPKGERNVAENRPYSEQSVDRLKSLYETHMKDDPFMELLMSEVGVSDALAFIKRMGLRELQGGRYRNKKDGTTPGSSWIKGRFKKWLARAGIELKGQMINHQSFRCRKAGNVVVVSGCFNSNSFGAASKSCFRQLKMLFG